MLLTKKCSWIGWCGFGEVGAEAESTGCRRPGAKGEERLSEGELLVFPGGGMSGVHADSELGGSGGWKRCAPLSLS